MSYFEKDRRKPGETYPISFDRDWRYLDPRELLVHRDNRETFQRWFDEFPQGLPDFCAATVAQLHHRRVLGREFVSTALAYCRAMVEERGFERTSLKNLALSNTNINHVMLVAGCQGPTIRKARVMAAYHVLSRLPRHIAVKIVFSGRNPAEPPTRVHILTHDEAADMEREFDTMMDHDASFKSHRNLTVETEHEARTSSENLGNFFKGDYLREANEAYLYLVSSTFHLRRLADEADKLISADQTLSDKIAKIVLIGGEEDPQDEPVMFETYYVKNMMFEVFMHMFRNRPIEVERTGEYEGAV